MVTVGGLTISQQSFNNVVTWGWSVSGGKSHMSFFSRFPTSRIEAQLNRSISDTR